MPESTPASPELLRLTFAITKILPTLDMSQLRDDEKAWLDATFGACASAIDLAADQAVRNRFTDVVLDTCFGDDPEDGGADDHDA